MKTPKLSVLARNSVFGVKNPRKTAALDKSSFCTVSTGQKRWNLSFEPGSPAARLENRRIAIFKCACYITSLFSILAFCGNVLQPWQPWQELQLPLQPLPVLRDFRRDRTARAAAAANIAITIRFPNIAGMV